MTDPKTLFERIILGEIPSVKVYEDDRCIVIMDKFPMTPGQSLVIPKQPIDYLFDLDTETYQHLWAVVQSVVHATDTALQPERTCVVVEGFEVPHAHIRIHPTYERELILTKGTMADDDTLTATAEKIKAALHIDR